jgi:hypothetical protein
MVTRGCRADLCVHALGAAREASIDDFKTSAVAVPPLRAPVRHEEPVAFMRSREHRCPLPRQAARTQANLGSMASDRSRMRTGHSVRTEDPIGNPGPRAVRGCSCACRLSGRGIVAPSPRRPSESSARRRLQATWVRTPLPAGASGGHRPRSADTYGGIISRRHPGSDPTEQPALIS